MARITLGRAMRSEAVRLRRSPLVWLHSVLAVALGGLAGGYFAFSAWDSLLGADAFVQLLGAGAPLLAGISCGLAADAEQRAGDGVNLLGVSSRRCALAAKTVMLLVLGFLAAMLAVGLFCAVLVLAGRPVPELSALVLAVLGIAGGSACLYVIFLPVALKWGRNLSIGLGALGFIAAMALMGGLANGLVTGTLSGALGVNMVVALPFAWPSRLASLPLEASIAAGAGATEQAQALMQAYVGVAAACAVATVVLVLVALACANRFETRHVGE